jgi:NAD(P)H-flavin reductase
MTPRLHRVAGRVRESDDVVTLVLEPLEGSRMTFRPGQFNMLSAPGVGEVAISFSGAPEEAALRHSVRDVGAVSGALCRLRVGDVVGVRGPFGSDWRVGEVDQDVVIVAGGVGLAPLRGAVRELVGRLGPRVRRVAVLVGARDPAQILFQRDLDDWAARGAQVLVTVDRAPASWAGRVGLVTNLIAAAKMDPPRTRALVCGPEIMMRFTARALEDQGVDPESILISLERNMQCGIGWCGHCQYGPLLVCRDGPVVRYRDVAHLLTERER